MYAAANNFDFSVDFGMSGRYKQLVQYRRESAHKGRAAWAVFSLGVCMRERQHIYEDLNESSSASPGGSQQLEIPPSLNSKRAANFFQIRWFFTWRGDFNVRQDSFARLYFCETPTFQIRLFFCEAPIFSKSAYFFCEIFFKYAYFSLRRQYFLNPPDSLKSRRMHLSMRQYFWRNCFNLRFKINIVVIII